MAKQRHNGIVSEIRSGVIQRIEVNDMHPSMGICRMHSPHSVNVIGDAGRIVKQTRLEGEDRQGPTHVLEIEVKGKSEFDVCSLTILSNEAMDTDQPPAELANALAEAVTEIANLDRAENPVAQRLNRLRIQLERQYPASKGVTDAERAAQAEAEGGA